MNPSPGLQQFEALAETRWTELGTILHFALILCKKLRQSTPPPAGIHGVGIHQSTRGTGKVSIRRKQASTKWAFTKVPEAQAR